VQASKRAVPSLISENHPRDPRMTVTLGKQTARRLLKGTYRRDSLKKASGNYKKKNKVRTSKNLRTRLFEEGQLEKEISW